MLVHFVLVRAACASVALSVPVQVSLNKRVKRLQAAGMKKRSTAGHVSFAQKVLRTVFAFDVMAAMLSVGALGHLRSLRLPMSFAGSSRCHAMPQLPELR